MLKCLILFFVFATVTLAEAPVRDEEAVMDDDDVGERPGGSQLD